MDQSSSIPEGYCQCGCGEWLGYHNRTSRTDGRIKGQPRQFKRGHNTNITYEERAEYRRQYAAERPDGVAHGECFCGCGQQVATAIRTYRGQRQLVGELNRYVQDHNSAYVDPALPKKCTKCKQIKPITDFFSEHSRRDGRGSHCKGCRSAYYENTKELHQQRTRRWYEANKERVRANQERWKQANMDHVREYHRRYARENKARIRRTQRRWYKANLEHIRRQNRRWRLKNADKQRARVRKRMAFRRGVPGDGATLSELISVHGSLCYLCGVVKADSVDHVIPISRGGTNYFDNLMPACGSCNSRKHDKTHGEYMEYLARLS